MPVLGVAAPIDPITIGSTLADLGGFALFLILAVVAGVGFFRKWFVFGWLFEERTRERDDARAEVKQLQLVVSKLSARLSRERPHRAGDPDA
jgi:uncharacterized membrane protein YciS (DUF1049 family)